MHPLVATLDGAAEGHFPPQDGEVEVLDAPPGRAQAIVSFTWHTVVATTLPPHVVRAAVPLWDPAGPLRADALVAIGRRLGRSAGGLDVVLVATGHGADAGLVLRPDEELDGHARVKRARRYRDNVSVWTDESRQAAVTVGQGLAGRWEVSLELEPSSRGQALGPLALHGVRNLLPPDVPLWAQVAPGNAASLRAFLAAGFTPVGAEVLFLPGGDDTSP